MSFPYYDPTIEQPPPAYDPGRPGYEFSPRVYLPSLHMLHISLFVLLCSMLDGPIYEEAQLAEDESSDSECGAANVAATATTNSHIAAAIFDLPTEININTMDPVVRDAWLSTLGNAVCPVPQHFAHAVIPPTIDPDPSPPSPTLTVSSITSMPTKKKKSMTVNKIQSVFEGMSLKETDEAEYSM
ncbi:hypothetical protein B0H13DRAFT_2304450 [Mycena leptocephala]|nr:hypothetical protein B0H13DRAFT_2304450 [Mycena leptocephala]